MPCVLHGAIYGPMSGPKSKGMRTPFRRSSESTSVDVEEEGNGNQGDGTESKDALSPGYANPAVHWITHVSGSYTFLVSLTLVDKQRKDAGEEAAQKGVDCDRTGRVLLKGVDEIVQRGLEDGEEAKANKDGSDDGCDPVNALVRGPAKEEETSRQEDGADHHRWQSSLRHRSPIVGHELLHVELVVPDVERGGEENADQQSEEGQGSDDEIPAALLLELDRKGGQVEIEQAVAEGGIDGDEKADGRGEELPPSGGRAYRRPALIPGKAGRGICARSHSTRHPTPRVWRGEPSCPSCVVVAGPS